MGRSWWGLRVEFLRHRVLLLPRNALVQEGEPPNSGLPREATLPRRMPREVQSPSDSLYLVCSASTSAACVDKQTLPSPYIHPTRADATQCRPIEWRARDPRTSTRGSFTPVQEAWKQVARPVTCFKGTQAPPQQ